VGETGELEERMLRADKNGGKSHRSSIRFSDQSAEETSQRSKSRHSDYGQRSKSKDGGAGLFGGVGNGNSTITRSNGSRILKGFRV